MRSTGLKGALAVLLAALVAGSYGGSAVARHRHEPLKGRGTGLKLVNNIPYSGGTDMEFATIKGHDYAFAGDAYDVGTDSGAIRIINIDHPAKPKLVKTLPCSLYQNDIQISYDKKTLIAGADSSAGPDSCGMLGKQGFITVDISNPKKAHPIGTADIPRGSHNTTAHPTKPYVYNSDSDLAKAGEFQIWSIKNPAKPKLVNTMPVVGHSPHDISFNKKGDLAVTASVSHFDLFDTSDPENPKLLFEGQCPGCEITHDAKFTPDGKRIVIGDEAAGGLEYPCPGGALYFYDLQGTKDNPIPVLTGIFEPGEFVSANGTTPGACTSHVFDFDPSGKHISISWYTAGTRYLDISSSAGPTIGSNGTGVKEVGYFVPEGGDSWSSKIYKDGYIFSNDINRGFDVYKILKK